MILVATLYIFDILKNQYFYVYHLEICNLIYLQYGIKFLIIYFFRYFFSYNDFIICIWSILLPLYILLLSFNDVLNIYLKLSPLNVEPYAILYYIIITSKLQIYIFTNKKNLNTGLLLNKWYVLLLYVNMDRAIIQQQPCVQKKDIDYFLFVKCPWDTKYIYIYFYNGHSLYILIGLNKYQLMVW